MAKRKNSIDKIVSEVMKDNKILNEAAKKYTVEKIVIGNKNFTNSGPKTISAETDGPTIQLIGSISASIAKDVAGFLRTKLVGTKIES